MYDKINLWAKHILKDDGFFYGVLIVLIAVCSFGLGRLSVAETNGINVAKVPISVEQKASVGKSAISGAESTKGPDTEEKSGETTVENYVASKSGTKFHLLTCSGAKQIKEENKIFFATKEEAMASGYAPAANCKGIWEALAQRNYFIQDSFAVVTRVPR